MPMRFLFLFSAFFAFQCTTPGATYALPSWVPVQERAAVSQVVFVADVVVSSSRNLNQTIDSAVVVLNIVSILKKPAEVDIPERLVLQFVLYPGSFESRMRTPPEPGRYFVFLNTEKTGKKDGGNFIHFRLYEPNPFAFALWSVEGEAELRRSPNRSHLKNGF